jgi:hypothetical protein
MTCVNAAVTVSSHVQAGASLLRSGGGLLAQLLAELVKTSRAHLHLPAASTVFSDVATRVS